MLSTEMIEDYKKELAGLTADAIGKEKAVQHEGIKEINLILVGEFPKGENKDMELIKKCEFTSNCLIKRINMINHQILLNDLEVKRIASIKNALEKIDWTTLQQSFDSLTESDGNLNETFANLKNPVALELLEEFEELKIENQEMISLVKTEMDNRPTAGEITKNIERFFPGVNDNDSFLYSEIKEILIAAIFEKKIVISEV